MDNIQVTVTKKCFYNNPQPASLVFRIFSLTSCAANQQLDRLPCKRIGSDESFQSLFLGTVSGSAKSIFFLSSALINGGGPLLALLSVRLFTAGCGDRTDWPVHTPIRNIHRKRQKPITATPKIDPRVSSNLILTGFFRAVADRAIVPVYIFSGAFRPTMVKPLAKTVLTALARQSLA